MSGHELFHTIASEPDARVRREIVARGLKARIDFRNVHFEQHRTYLVELGGDRTPALWDGTHLHQGEEAVLRILRDMMPAQ